jgi:hypothetical protein
MKNRLLALILIVTISVLVIGTVAFIWRHQQPLPSEQQVETLFSREIGILEELTSQLDLSQLKLDKPALPDLDQVAGISPVIPSIGPIQEVIGKAREAESQFGDSKVLSAGILFEHSGSSSSILVRYDDSLNIWSPDYFLENKKDTSLGYCYSGLRQFIEFRKVVSSDSDQTVSFRLIFAPEALE